MARVDGIQDGYARGKADRTAWLIEIHAGSLTEGEASGPQYFQLAHDDDWTKDHDKALQFARKQDAEAYIAHIGWTYATATEHMWPWPTSNAGPITIANDYLANNAAESGADVIIRDLVQAINKLKNAHQALYEEATSLHNRLDEAGGEITSLRLSLMSIEHNYVASRALERSRARYPKLELPNVEP